MNLEIVNRILSEDIIAVDTETTGLNPRKDKITDLVITGAHDTICIPILKWDGTGLIECAEKHQIMHVLQTLSKRKLVFHNAQFDVAMIKGNYDIDLSDALYADTMLQAHTVNENELSYGLKPLAVKYLSANADDEKVELLEHLKAIGAGKDFYKADPEIRGRYAEQDGRITYDLFQFLDAELRKQRLESFFYDDEVMPLLKYVTIPMESTGVKLDMDKLSKLQEEITADIAKLEAEIQAEIAPLLGNFLNWYMDKTWPVKFSGEFLHELMTMLAPPNWPKTDSGSFSLSATSVCKAKKAGLLPPLSLVESYIGEFKDGERLAPIERLPEDVVNNIRQALMKKSGTTYPFNLSSKDHLKRLYFGTTTVKSLLKEKPLNTTDKGNPQVDEEFLEVMAKKYPWSAKLIVFNKLNKISGAYFARFLEEQEDGIFYPRFLQHRTVSGRYGSDFQQLSRPIENPQPGDLVAKYTNEIRKVFVSRQNSIFVDIDYVSLEPHVFSHVSGDANLQKIFNDNLDFYSTIAIGAEKLTDYSPNPADDNYLGKKNKAARQKAKAYSLGIPYGLGDFKLSKDLGISQGEAASIINNYFNSFPELKKWFDNTKTLVCKQGYIKTEAGRIRHLPYIKQMYEKYGETLFNSLELWKAYHEEPRTYSYLKDVARTCKNELNNARNVQIQSLGASIVNKACILIAKELKKFKDAHIIAQIHDQIVVECLEVDKEIIGAIMENIMVTCWKLSVKLKAPPSFGYNLGESKG